MDITFSIFPKFYASYSVEQLAELVGQVGLDAVNLVIRKGYWVSPDNLAAEAPAFVQKMDQAGVKVTFATAGFSAEEIIADDTPLKVLADCGICEFRMGYFRGFKEDPAAGLDDARAKMEQVAEVCSRAKIRAVYQVHHGTLIPSALAAYYMLRDLPPEAVGVMIDPGNQMHEGREKFGRSVRLLGDFLSSAGIKDVTVSRDADRADQPDKGWSMQWDLLSRGMINWHDFVRALKSVDFGGTFVWMPFYHEKDTDAMTKGLAEEVAYMRKVVQEIDAEEE